MREITLQGDTEHGRRVRGKPGGARAAPSGRPKGSAIMLPPVRTAVPDSGGAPERISCAQGICLVSGKNVASRMQALAIASWSSALDVTSARRATLDGTRRFRALS